VCAWAHLRYTTELLVLDVLPSSCLHGNSDVHAGATRPEMLHPRLATASSPELRGLLLVGDLSAYSGKGGAAVWAAGPPPRLTSQFGFLPAPRQR
jgi:hypothetical protein